MLQEFDADFVFYGINRCITSPGPRYGLDRSMRPVELANSQAAAQLGFAKNSLSSRARN
jgi:hypothetical protein